MTTWAGQSAGLFHARLARVPRRHPVVRQPSTPPPRGRLRARRGEAVVTNFRGKFLVR